MRKCGEKSVYLQANKSHVSMKNKDEFLPQDILNNLTLRVAQTLPCMKDSKNPLAIWDRPIEWCLSIEGNIREVDTVILMAKKETGYWGTRNSNPSIYQVILTRVYILLYYRHSDDNLYNHMVFPELIKYMGIYAEKHLNKINELVGKMLEMDRLIEQDRQEKKQNLQQKYRYIRLNKGEADEYFSEFNKEALFRQISVALERVVSKNRTIFDVAEVWLTAKDIVQKLWHEIAPETFIERILKDLSLSASSKYVEVGIAKDVMLCVYLMMQSVTSSDHFHKAIAQLEKFPENSDNYPDLQHNILELKKVIIDGTIQFDKNFSYVDGTNPEPETFTKTDVERILSDNIQKLELLEKQMEEKDKELASLAEWKENAALLKEENRQLKEQLEEANKRPQEKAESEEVQHLKETIQRLEEEKEAIAVKLVSAFFKETLEQESLAKQFLYDIKDQSDDVIGGKVRELKQDKLSPRRSDKDLWRILCAFGYYHSSDRNFSAALRKTD